VPTLFYLAYQGLNDRDIQRDYARFFLPVHPPVAAMPRSRGGGSSKIRVGFISRFFRDHTIGRLMRGLIAQLSRDIFEVTVLAIGHSEDAMARFIQEHACHYVRLPQNPLAAAPIVAGQELDLLFYTDVGMESTNYVLAHSRLAPVQCVTWGHPVTTGLPMIDYFLSTSALELDNADEHYTEQLVRLKHLSIYYYRPCLAAAAKTRQAFGLAADRHLYLCPQSLFKLHPEFDSYLQGILQADLQGQLILLNVQQGGSQQLLETRFRRTMPREQERITFLPRQTTEDFLQLLRVADVMLDPLHFGGGNTTYEALAVGTPVITLPGPFLRGRITYACYRQMELFDCVAENRDDYIQRAVRLGTEPEWRHEVRSRILARHEVLYENAEAVREVEQFLIEAVNRSR
jgi:predicted O-linked N-acetylglucosamine transferase (SPINDLY family)